LGVASFFFSKAVLPIGLLALLGVGLFAFRSQIVGAISGGATTLGQAITTPFGSFLQGIQQGFGSIPESIDFRLPSFNFIFGQSDPGNDPIGQLQTDFDNFIKNSQEFFDNLFKSGSGGGTGTPPPPTTLPPGEFPLDEETAGGSLTEFETASGKFVTTSSTGGQGQVTMTETLAQILERNREAVGLFDFKFTPGMTEFFALSPSEIEFFGAENLIFSGQLFQEIKNIEQALAFG